MRRLLGSVDADGNQEGKHLARHFYQPTRAEKLIVSTCWRLVKAMIILL